MRCWWVSTIDPSEGGAFYEQGEKVPIPCSFELIAELDQKMIYAKGAYGRSVEWKLDRYLGRYGWVVKKLVRSGTDRYVDSA